MLFPDNPDIPEDGDHPFCAGSVRGYRTSRAGSQKIQLGGEGFDTMSGGALYEMKGKNARP